MIDKSESKILEVRLLARVYELILSWNESRTADSEHFGEDTEPAEETTADDAGAS